MEKETENRNQRTPAAASGPLECRPLSLVPPPKAAPRGTIITTGLTLSGSSPVLEVAFCSEHQNEGCLLVKRGSRSARCRQCKERHRVVGLIGAVGASLVNIGDDGAVPCLAVDELIELAFRELKSRAEARKKARPADSAKGLGSEEVAR